MRVLAEVLEHALRRRPDAMDEYSPRAPAQVWKAQHFLLLLDDDDAALRARGSAFDRRRQLVELESVVSSQTGSRYLAQVDTGWPSVR